MNGVLSAIDRLMASVTINISSKELLKIIKVPDISM